MGGQGGEAEEREKRLEGSRESETVSRPNRQI